jgi:hypothetical protein
MITSPWNAVQGRASSRPTDGGWMIFRLELLGKIQRSAQSGIRLAGFGPTDF